MQEAICERREELNLLNCVCEVYMIIRYLLITVLCFSAIAYLANEGHGLIAVGVLALWIFLVSVLSGSGFGLAASQSGVSDLPDSATGLNSDGELDSGARGDY